MKQKLKRFPAVILCFLILALASNVSAANKSKVWIGTGLIVGGVGFGAHAASNVFCGGFDVFPPSEQRNRDGCHQDVEMVAGIAMIGAGTFFLIKGIREDNGPNETKKRMNSLNQTVSMGFGPVKNGWAGGIRIRW